MLPNLATSPRERQKSSARRSITTGRHELLVEGQTGSRFVDIWTRRPTSMHIDFTSLIPRRSLLIVRGEVAGAHHSAITAFTTAVEPNWLFIVPRRHMLRRTTTPRKRFPSSMDFFANKLSAWYKAGCILNSGCYLEWSPLLLA